MSNSLLARFALNAYWMARDVERAENLARILEINETYAREHHGGPDWLRVLDLYDDTKRFYGQHESAEAEAVLHFYVIDRDNPSSIAATIGMARENARVIRHLISTEMWTHLNIIRNRIAALHPRDIKLGRLSRVCEEVKRDCQTFEGIAEGTFFRGPAWCFYQVGKYIERADQTTRVLYMGYDRLMGKEAGEGTVNTVQWNALLRSVAAYHAFRSQRPSGMDPQDIATFLLYDRGFPRAVGLCVDRVTEILSYLEERHGQPRQEVLEVARRRLVFLLDTGLGKQITQKRLHKFLDDLQRALIDLSNEISRTYFGVS